MVDCFNVRNTKLTSWNSGADLNEIHKIECQYNGVVAIGLWI